VLANGQPGKVRQPEAGTLSLARRPNANGNTPFAIATQHKRAARRVAASRIAGLDIAEVLLQHGVNIAPVNKKGSTPFFFACQEGNLDVVKFLVRNGADTSIGKNGISPFHMACYRGHLDVVTYLVVEVDIDPLAVDGSGRTPLEVARRAGKEEVIRFLEQLDADKQREVDPLPLCAGPNGSCSDAGCVIA